MSLPLEGRVLISVNDFDKGAALKIARDLHRMGFRLYATHGTADFFRRVGLPVDGVNKVSQGSPHVLDLINEHRVNLILNTPLGPITHSDGALIRTAATRMNVSLLTTLVGPLLIRRSERISGWIAGTSFAPSVCQSTLRRLSTSALTGTPSGPANSAHARMQSSIQALCFFRRSVSSARLPRMPPMVSELLSSAASSVASFAVLAAAAMLGQHGYAAQIFDRGAAGGMCRAIPRQRLDRALLRDDVQFALSMSNVRYRRRGAVGNPSALLARGYDAVIVAAGLWDPIVLPVPNARFAIKGLEFLARPASFRLNGHVAVIGGGATALDCAVTAKARGAVSSTQLRPVRFSTSCRITPRSGSNVRLKWGPDNVCC